MGQYYKAVFVKDNKTTPIAYLESWDFENGAKLMEHSYLENDFVSAVTNLMTKGQPFYKGRIIWSGDYADPRKKSYKNNLYEITSTKKLKYDGDIDTSYKPSRRFVVNHSKKSFIDLEDIKADEYGFRIHPLPLLTADGNGRGGGDYIGSEMEYIGKWIGDSISIEEDMSEYPNYKKLIIDFAE